MYMFMNAFAVYVGKYNLLHVADYQVKAVPKIH